MPRSLLARLQFAALAGLVLFAPDDGGAAGGDAGGTNSTGAGGASTGTDGGTPPPAPTDPPADPLAGLTPEQTAAVEAAKRAAVNAAIAPKVAHERTQWEAELKALAEAESQTAEQQAQAAAATARAEADAAIAKANDTLKTAAAQLALGNAKVPAERIGVALPSLDLSDVEVKDGKVNAEQLAAKVAEFTEANPWIVAAAGTPVPAGASSVDGGSNPAQQKPTTLAEAYAARRAATAA